MSENQLSVNQLSVNNLSFFIIFNFLNTVPHFRPSFHLPGRVAMIVSYPPRKTLLWNIRDVRIGEFDQKYGNRATALIARPSSTRLLREADNCEIIWFEMPEFPKDFPPEGIVGGTASFAAYVQRLTFIASYVQRPILRINFGLCLIGPLQPGR